MLSLRTLLRHPIQFGIMILGIALGVGVMVAIDIANATAARAFEWSTDAVTGRATHSIVAGEQGVDEELYASLRTDPHWRQTLESAPLSASCACRNAIAYIVIAPSVIAAATAARTSQRYVP